MSVALVAGGGIAGIISSLVLKDKFEKVIVVDKNENIGGLLRSRTQNGFSFDYGCHFLRETGVQKLDKLIYKDVRGSRDWHYFDYLKSGSFFKGVLNEHAQFLDARLLDEDDYRNGILECLSAIDESVQPSNLDHELICKFGPTLTNKLFKPVVKKYFHDSYDTLVPGANSYFFPQRILGFDETCSRLLKQVPQFDEKLGFHSFSDGLSGLTNFYPKSGGIGKWIDLLELQMLEKGIVLATGNGISEIFIQDSKVEKVQLDNMDVIDCEQLVWTLPPALFLKNSNRSFESLHPPRKLTSTVINFVVDKPPQTELHFLTCHEPSMKTFRVTLYPNIQNSSDKCLYNLTVECISNEALLSNELHLEVMRELILMNVLHPATKIEFYERLSMPNTFPVPTAQYLEGCENLLMKCKQLTSNTLFLGKSTGSKWFMNDIMIDSYNESVKVPKI